MSSWKWRRAAWLLAFGLAAAWTALAQVRIGTQAHLEREAAPEAFVPRPDAARLAGLGFDSLVADFYWLRAIQVVAYERGHTDKHATLLARLMDLVTRLDPHVGHPYRFAAAWLTDSPESVRKANRILERGIAYHPADWRNRFHLAFNHFFYLGDNRAAARELEPAIQLPGAPHYLGRLLARLRFESSSLEVTRAFLVELLEQTEDPYRRAEYEKALDEIETERRARVLDAARARYRERFSRDIETVEDLLRGERPVLRRLPPEPHGWEWVLDPESGEIVSSYLEKRYRLHLQRSDRERIERWQEREAEAGRPRRGREAGA